MEFELHQLKCYAEGETKFSSQRDDRDKYLYGLQQRGLFPKK